VRPLHYLEKYLPKKRSWMPAAGRYTLELAPRLPGGAARPDACQPGFARRQVKRRKLQDRVVSVPKAPSSIITFQPNF
jgi:hypothetical protein